MTSKTPVIDYSTNPHLVKPSSQQSNVATVAFAQVRKNIHSANEFHPKPRKQSKVKRAKESKEVHVLS